VRSTAGGKEAAASGRRISPEEKSRGTPASGAAVSGEVPASVPPQDPVSPGTDPEWLAKYNVAVQAQRQGDWETSARLFQEAISSNPALIEGWNGLGISLGELGKYGEAEDAFRKALALDPEYPAALVNAGLLRMREGRIEEAAGMFERAVVIEPRWSAARVNLAIAQTRQGRDRDAETTLLAARRIFPDDPDVLYHLGMALERKGDRFAAGKTYSEFLAVSAGRYPDRERLVADRLRDWNR
ncbi:MAG: tetratricopeptide repeat protein, partial [Candidatus Deferrimicrobiaceae bacterium]